MIQISITAPVFKCLTDEDAFYQRLSEIKGLQKVVDQKDGVFLSVAMPQTPQLLTELDQICAFWGVSYLVVSA